eukprot:15460579-Alexandrium_andersonii.AAC.1
MVCPRSLADGLVFLRPSAYDISPTGLLLEAFQSQSGLSDGIGIRKRDISKGLGNAYGRLAYANLSVTSESTPRAGLAVLPNTSKSLLRGGRPELPVLVGAALVEKGLEDRSSESEGDVHDAMEDTAPMLLANQFGFQTHQ